MKEQKHSLKPDNILIAEYEYAAETAFQTNEDRIKVSNYFLGTIATVAASVLLDQNIELNRVIITIVAMLLAIFGFLALLKLIRLRIAWRSSIRSMNQIKEFYTEHTSTETFDLQKAFHWKEKRVPKLAKISTINFLIALELILTNSFLIGFCLYLNTENDLFFAVLISTQTVFLQIILWFWILRSNEGTKG